ncbi:MAG: response regulator transcription factor [Betaproteobacteria bacterium]|nr:MAG: response regulator transcription factor [Betaproteobacteria bacterium]TMH89379.1 MAG: response regulator transcription factor [Betaproteobacteria bacterium]
MTVTVLLADDHAVVRDGLRALLETGDLQVVATAGNGREAVAEALRLRPDIVIMDIAMPELDGVEATRRIVEKCPETRVLILSMYLSAEHIYRALQAGAQGYVLKESAGEEVVEAIRTLRAGKRYLSHRITETVIDDYLREGANVSPLDSLSLRERDVLQLVVEGRTNAAIAQALSLSPKTVETYRARIMKKLKVRDTVELVKFSMRHGLIS